MNFLESVGLAFLIFVGLVLLTWAICIVYKYSEFISAWLHTYLILDDDESECPDFADPIEWERSLLNK